MEIIILLVFLLIFIDIDRINVPLWQFVYLDESYSLLYDIDDVYSLEEISWTGPDSQVIMILFHLLRLRMKAYTGVHL